jgi:spermidine/putrescine transport system ATP-binding protein
MTPSRGTLELTSLRREYNNFILDVNLIVKAGELVSLLGPSGSGKTTTLKIIAGFETADAGSVFFDGRDITHERPWNRGFGFVPQDLVLFPHLDVAGNVSYGLRAKHVPKDHVRRRSDELLSFVGLDGFNRRRVETLSGGERQRVALARALAVDPGLLLLDEPFSALDAPLRREMRDEVRRVTRELGISALFVTHNQDEGLSISDSVAIMNNGVVVQQDTPEKIFLQPADRYVAGFIGTTNVLPVTVEGMTEGLLTVAGHHAMKVKATRAVGFERGDSAHLMIRPHNFSFCSADSQNAIPVHIESRRFLGDRYEYTCLSGSLELSVLDAKRLDTGREVCIGFDPADGYLLAVI